MLTRSLYQIYSFEANKSNIPIFFAQMFYELGKQVVTKFRTSLADQAQNSAAKQDVLLVTDASTGNRESKSSGCC